jgi:probable O-glycosylation ligase (exosortase A-associated)
MLTDRQRIHALIWLMVISNGYFGVKGGIFTLRTGGDFIVRGPAATMIEDRNHLAVALLVVVPLMNYLRQQSRHAVIRWGLIVAIACTLFAVVGSQSRGALVSLAATAFVLWLRSRGKLVSGIAIAAAVGLAILFMPDTWVARMETIRNYQTDESAIGRLTIWRAAILLALMRPLVGSGFLGFYNQYVVNMVDPSIEARASHSIWLEVLGEHGFPTFFVWLAILGFGTLYTFTVTRHAAKRPDLAWAYDLARMMQVSIVAYCSGGSFLSLSYWDLFWTLLVVAGALRALVLEAVRQPAAGTAADRGHSWRGQRAAPGGRALWPGGRPAS